MEIQGKIVKILDAQKFVSQKNGNEYVKNAFILETQGQYPKTLCFTVMGQERWDKMGIKVGGNFAVSFDPESREWNGKFFTDLSAWKAVNLDAGQSGQTQQPAAQAPAQGVSPFPTADAQPSGDADSLPF